MKKEKIKTIKIACNGNRTVPLDALVNFQGGLKTLSDDAAAKLKRLIIKRGFSFPVFVWGGDKIIDGHQRVEVVRRLVADGYSLAGEIPVCDIEAGSEKEAAEKLLELQGRFGDMAFSGLDEFIKQFSVDIETIAPDLDIPEMSDFLKSVTGEKGIMYSAFNDIKPDDSDQPDGESGNKKAEQRIPVTIILSGEEHARWEALKRDRFGGKNDKSVILKIIKDMEADNV